VADLAGHLIRRWKTLPLHSQSSSPDAILFKWDFGDGDTLQTFQDFLFNISIMQRELLMFVKVI